MNDRTYRLYAEEDITAGELVELNPSTGMIRRITIPKSAVEILADDIDRTRKAICRPCRDKDWAQFNPHTCMVSRQFMSKMIREAMKRDQND